MADRQTFPKTGENCCRKFRSEGRAQQFGPVRGRVKKETESQVSDELIQTVCTSYRTCTSFQGIDQSRAARRCCGREFSVGAFGSLENQNALVPMRNSVFLRWCGHGSHVFVSQSIARSHDPVKPCSYWVHFCSRLKTYGNT